MSDQDKPQSPRPGKRHYFSASTSPADILASLKHEAQEQEQAKGEQGTEQEVTDTDPSNSG